MNKRKGSRNEQTLCKDQRSEDQLLCCIPSLAFITTCLSSLVLIKCRAVFMSRISQRPRQKGGGGGRRREKVVLAKWHKPAISQPCFMTTSRADIYHLLWIGACLPEFSTSSRVWDGITCSVLSMPWILLRPFQSSASLFQGRGACLPR